MANLRIIVLAIVGVIFTPTSARPQGTPDLSAPPSVAEAELLATTSSRETLENPPEIPKTFIPAKISCFRFFPGTVAWNTCQSTINLLVMDFNSKMDAYEAEMAQWLRRLPGQGPIEVNDVFGIKTLARGLDVTPVPSKDNGAVAFDAHVGEGQKIEIHRSKNGRVIWFGLEETSDKWILVLLPQLADDNDLHYHIANDTGKLSIVVQVNTDELTKIDETPLKSYVLP